LIFPGFSVNLKLNFEFLLFFQSRVDFLERSCILDYNEFNTALGASIRNFRKLQHISQRDLADKLGKSVACVSKYESGSIAIDVCTLYEISHALNVTPQLLLPTDKSQTWSASFNSSLPTMFQREVLYFYVYVGDRHYMFCNALEIYQPSSQVTLYIDLRDQRDYKNCKYIMTGEIRCNESIISIYCTNPLLNSDFMLLNFNRANLLGGNYIGLCTTLTPTFKFRALKCYISTVPISNPESIQPKLEFSREELADIKRFHSLIV
jgi:transcriptional regulator with XRE-family HTH domain